jgi:predicted DNA-binding WGR domain protein
MNRLMADISKSLEDTIDRYICEVSKKFGLEQKDLVDTWRALFSEEKVLPKVVLEMPESVLKTKKVQGGSSCQYKYVRGDKAGEVCGSATKEGNAFCSKHKKKDVSGEKGKEEKKERKSGSPVLALNRNKKLGVLFHKESNLVFKSESEKIVVGKLVENEVVPLKDEDVDECRRWGFKFERDFEKKVVLPSKVLLVSDEKFWESYVENGTLFIRYGKKGKGGRTSTKIFETDEEAFREMEKEVSRKRADGYSEESVKKEDVSLEEVMDDVDEVKRSRKDVSLALGVSPPEDSEEDLDD